MLIGALDNQSMAPLNLFSSLSKLSSCDIGAGERKMASGHCLCGQLKFQSEGEPEWVVYCHCASCRRHTGSPVTCFVNFKSGKVTFSGDRSTFASSPGVTRSFCAQCGTPVAYETSTRSDEIDLYLNVFDEPAAFTPQKHVYFDEHIPWFDVRDDLPRE